MRNGRERWMVHKPWDTGKQLSSIALSPSSAPGSGWQYKTLSWRKGRTQSQGCHHSSSFPTPSLILSSPNSENSPTTHRSKRMLNLMVGCLQGLPGKMRYLSSPSPVPSPLPSFLCPLPLPHPRPLLHGFHLLTRSSMVCHLFSLSRCLSLLSPGPPTFQPFHLLATSRVTSPTVHPSHMTPHLIPLCQLPGFPWGGGVWKRTRKTGWGMALILQKLSAADDT